MLQWLKMLLVVPTKTLSGIVFFVAVASSTVVYQNCSRTGVLLTTDGDGSASKVLPASDQLTGLPFGLSTSFPTPNACQTTLNDFIVTLDVPNNYDVACFDASFRSNQNFPTCDGLPSVADTIPVTGGWVQCLSADVRLCGVAPIAAPQLIDQTATVKKYRMVFRNLPWGCEAKMNVAVIPGQITGIDLANEAINSQNRRSFTQTVALPACRTCEGTSMQTCGVCPSTDPAGSCRFEGNLYLNGQTFTRFRSATVAAGESCQSTGNQQVFTCSNGTLSPGTPGMGAYAGFTQLSCSVLNASNCVVQDAQNQSITIPHGSQRDFYTTATVPFGSDCNATATKRTVSCNNGTPSMLTTALFSTCAAQPGANCRGPDNSNILHNDKKVYYSATTASGGMTCAQLSQERVCFNGSLSGTATFTHAACSDPAACVHLGQSLTEGQTLQFFVSSTPNSAGECSGKVFTCARNTNGALELKPADNSVASISSYQSLSCKNSCRIGSVLLAHTGPTSPSRLFYSSETVPSSQSCSSVAMMLSCNDGTVAGGDPTVYRFANCQRNCATSGGDVSHGSENVFFAQANVASGTCQDNNNALRLRCEDGNLLNASGQAVTTYQQRTCYAPNSCTVSARILQPNERYTFFNSDQVVSSVTCASRSQERMCSLNASTNTYQLTGDASFSFLSCAQNCDLAGTEMKSGDVLMRYQTASAFCASADTKQEWRCNNGQLSRNGTALASLSGQTVFSSNSCVNYTYSWDTGTYGSCTGGSGTWNYSAWGGCSATACNTTGTQTRSAVSCSFAAASGSRTRSVACKRNDGTLVLDSMCTGTKPIAAESCTPTDSNVCGSPAVSQACSARACNSCSAPGGGTLAHGQSGTYYTANFASGSCGNVAETRTCSDGTLSGSASIASCSPVSCPSGYSPTTHNGEQVCQSPTTTALLNNQYYPGAVMCPQGYTAVGGYKVSGFVNGDWIGMGCHGVLAQMINNASGETVSYLSLCAHAKWVFDHGPYSGVVYCKLANSSIAMSGTKRCLHPYFYDQSYDHGATITVYSTSSVASPQSCSSVSQQMTCSNGSWTNYPAFGSALPPSNSCSEYTPNENNN
jgi:hypothetical protein